jgi:hypothetical protein
MLASFQATFSAFLLVIGTGMVFLQVSKVQPGPSPPQVLNPLEQVFICVGHLGIDQVWVPAWILLSAQVLNIIVYIYNVTTTLTSNSNVYIHFTDYRTLEDVRHPAVSCMHTRVETVDGSVHACI